MADFKIDIRKNLAVLREGTKGWKREVNIISWNERSPKIDIRDWDPDHKKMGNGISLSKEEVQELKRLLTETNLEALPL